MSTAGSGCVLPSNWVRPEGLGAVSSTSPSQCSAIFPPGHAVDVEADQHIVGQSGIRTVQRHEIAVDENTGDVMAQARSGLLDERPQPGQPVGDEG
nr:hypothetical protein [Rothia kristinae]